MTLQEEYLCVVYKISHISKDRVDETANMLYSSRRAGREMEVITTEVKNVIIGYDEQCKETD
jgi:hypothetical protein